jgi:hypothetical protein
METTDVDIDHLEHEWQELKAGGASDDEIEKNLRRGAKRLGISREVVDEFLKTKEHKIETTILLSEQLRHTLRR